MAEASTIARPYAQAIFQLAQQNDRLQEWSNTLAYAEAIVCDPQMVALINNPKMADSKIVATILSVAGESLTDEGKNFIKLLAQNGRLGVFADIVVQFEKFRAEAEKTITAEVVSAYDVSEAQQSEIASALKNRLGCDVTLVCRTDETLLGGAVIRAGDLVIDGSVTGQIDRLKSELSH